MTEAPVIVAIDGPAGSGKSTVARAVAARLGLDYLDTGAMYRAIAFAALQADVDLDDGEALAALAAETSIDIGARVVVSGHDATAEIRGPEVGGAVSTVAAHPGVRADLVDRQRAWVADHEGGVVEGRDIGTVVFPDATLKVFLTADEAERVRRRVAEGGSDVGAQVTARDAIDSTRKASPLQPAEDAVIIDTTGRTIDEIVEEVLAKL